MKKFNLKINPQMFGLGLGLLMFIFMIILLSSVVLIFKGAIAPWILFSSLITAISIMCWYLWINKVPRKNIIVSGVIILVIVLLSILTASKTIDTTFDGNRYHKPAVGALRYGWNPLYQSISDFEKSENNPFTITDSASHYSSPWPDPYAKGTWMFAANIYSLTNNIESGKAINMLSIFMVFFFALSLLTGITGRKSSLLLASALALNPVALQQLYSFYNDGVQGNLIITITTLLTIVVFAKLSKHNLIFTLTAIGMAIAVVSNIKFTGLAYAGIVCLTYFTYLLAKRDWKLAQKMSVVGIASLVIGVGVIGSSTYVTNLMLHDNPLYPLVGKDRVDIVTHVQPKGFNQNSKVVKFLKSNLYQTSNLYLASNAEPQYKIPFTINSREIKALSGPPDTRQAGYGVWFGGILIATLFIGAYVLYLNRRKNLHTLMAFILPLLPIGLIVLSIEGAWWARYLPQLILYPVIISIVLILMKQIKASTAIASAVLVNSLLVGALAFNYQLSERNVMRNNIASHIKCESGSTVALGYAKHYGPLYNVLDNCSDSTILVSKIDTPTEGNYIHLYQGMYKIEN